MKHSSIPLSLARETTHRTVRQRAIEPLQTFAARAIQHRTSNANAPTLREKVIKIGAKVIAHGRYLVFQMAEVAVPRALFGRLLERIARLRPLVVARC